MLVLFDNKLYMFVSLLVNLGMNGITQHAGYIAIYGVGVEILVWVYLEWLQHFLFSLVFMI